MLDNRHAAARDNQSDSRRYIRRIQPIAAGAADIDGVRHRWEGQHCRAHGLDQRRQVSSSDAALVQRGQKGDNLWRFRRTRRESEKSKSFSSRFRHGKSVKKCDAPPHLSEYFAVMTQQKPKSFSGDPIRHLALSVAGMHCSNCVGRVEH